MGCQGYFCKCCSQFGYQLKRFWQIGIKSSVKLVQSDDEKERKGKERDYKSESGGPLLHRAKIRRRTAAKAEEHSL